MITLSVYELLVIAEMVLLVAVLAGVFLYRWRATQRKVDALHQALAEAKSAPEVAAVARPPEAVVPAAPQRSYADHLREQLECSAVLLGDTASGQTPDDKEEAVTRQMLEARGRFLQIELDLQGSDGDVEAQRESVVQAMQAFLADLSASAAASPDELPDQPATDAVEIRVERSEEAKLREQIGHLRSVIDNQYGVMRELRQLLEEHADDSEELQEILRKLSDAEAQAIELQRCVEVIEQENARLRADGGDAVGPRSAQNPDADMLRDLVGSQQRTISKLQSMLHTLTPDPAKTKELGEAIGKIQRANNELNSCVMVLEDENSMLRGQLETLQHRIADLEAQSLPGGGAEVPENSTTETTADSDPEEPAAAREVDAGDSDTNALLADLFGSPERASPGER